MYQITAKAPTIYQRPVLKHFRLHETLPAGGAYIARQVFQDEETAKAHLVEAAEAYYDEYPGQADEALETIKEAGVLEIDSVKAIIEKL